MDVLRYQSHPKLRHPVMVASFRGWNDAAEAASTAALYLRTAWRAESFADIDPEEFFDFTVQRPHVSLVDGVTRRIDWPSTEFASAAMGSTDRDAIILTGTEPSVRWRSFCEAVLTVAADTGVEMIITLGALLADVPHSRPVRVFGTAADQALVERLGLTASRYEGPTGIVGVLHDACRSAGIPSVSLWASTPAYVPGLPSPKAALELVRRFAQLVGVDVDTRPLEEQSRTYEARIAAAVEADPDMAAAVQQLEERSDSEQTVSGEELAEEFQRFLQGLREDDT